MSTTSTSCSSFSGAAREIVSTLPGFIRSGNLQQRGIRVTGPAPVHLGARHYRPTLAVYDSSMRRNFRRRFMRDENRIRMAILFPTEADLPNSPLHHYLALANATLGESFDTLFERTCPKCPDDPVSVSRTSDYWHRLVYAESRQGHIDLIPGCGRGTHQHLEKA